MEGSGSAGSDEPGSDTPDSPEPVLYHWTCPFCGKVGIQSATSDDVERYVVNAVRSHVRSTDGDGHGPRRKLPEDEDVESAILEHVRVVGTDD